MALCVYCKTETELYSNGRPICIPCDNKTAALVRDLADATMQADAASDEFQAVVTEIPSGMPHPDGVLRIKNVSHRLSTARDQMVEAQDRLDEFQGRRIAPEDANRQKRKGIV